MSSAAGVAPARRDQRAAVVGLLVLVLVAVVGLAWAKWVPYAGKVAGLVDTRAWDGDSILATGGTSPSLQGAWDFTVAYTEAIWRALVVSLLVAAALDALVPRRWIVALLARRGSWRQAAAGGLASMPTMMCTCCTAPVTVSLRRAGAPVPAAVGHWLGNPVLNPAVLVFLFLVAPWEWGVVRLVVGVALVLGAGGVAGRLARSATAEDVEALLPADEPTPRLRELPGRYLRSLARLSIVLVPEYAVVVLLVGGLSGWLSQFASLDDRLGVPAVLVAALIGTLLVVPTGGEIPVVLALASLGAGAGMVGALLVTLPALSLPSMVMVAKALSPRVTVVLGGTVALTGLVAAAALALVS